MAVCDTHVVISQSSEHDKDLAVPTLEVAILEGRARKQDGTERYLVGRQPVERLSEHCGTQTDSQTDRQTAVIRRVAPVAQSTLHTISSPRMSLAYTFETVLCRAGEKLHKQVTFL